MCQKEYDGFMHNDSPGEDESRIDNDHKIQTEISSLLDRLVNLKKFIEQPDGEELNAEGIQHAIDSTNKKITINVAAIGEIHIGAANEDRPLRQKEQDAIETLTADIQKQRERLAYLELAKLEYSTYSIGKAEIEEKYNS